MTDVTARNKRAHAAGRAWNNQCLPWLRDLWPSADRQVGINRHDVTGIGDLGIETTIVPWEDMHRKLAQAERDATVRGIGLWCVWKKARRTEVTGVGSADPGESPVVFRARVIFPALRLLQRYEREELDAAEAYDRGYSNGFEAGLKSVREGSVRPS